MNSSISIAPLAHQLYAPSYPNVAAEPSMYWPRVRIMPLGPGPYLMMFVAPKMKPMIRPTAVEYQSLTPRLVLSFPSHILPPIMPPILARRY